MTGESRVTLRPGPLTAEDRVDIVCDAFEAQWRSGQSPRIESHLDACAAADRKQLFAELLLVEIEMRRNRGERPCRDDYLQRFPEFSGWIESVLTANERRGESTVLFGAHDRAGGRRPSTGQTSGAKVGRFVLTELVGEGASGEVWRAHDAELKRDVAIKIPRRRDLTPDELQRFLREGQAAAQLRHPNIVGVYEVGRDADQAYIVSEFVAGADLAAWMANRRPAVDDSAELCAQLADGLHHAHEHGVIHRDFKPANVIIDANGHPLIADFGLAKWVSDVSQMTMEGQVLGTPAYMSPEQARGDAARVDRRSDVFSLGVLFYEMLTGSRAFQGDVAAVVHDVIHKDPPPPRVVNRLVPRDLETVCLKAIAKEPARRYPTAQEMAVDLRRFLRGEPIVARRAGMLERSIRWVRRRPAMASSLVLALVASAALVGLKIQAMRNYELLGLQTTTLSTSPPGAKIAFVPLNRVTGEPQLKMARHASGVSPVEEDLAPGDYLVVAVLDDGRFHEVYRHVPEPTEVVPYAHNHDFSERLPDKRVVLPIIEIPDHDVTEGMALIEGQDEFQMGSIDAGDVPASSRSVASFYIDCAEFTYTDAIPLVQSPPQEFRQRGDNAMSVSFDDAMRLAEKAGKRLPMEVEFEFAATARGQFRYPWGDDFPDVEVASEFGPNSTPSFDRLATIPPVYGLCSGKAEWTSSWPTAVMPEGFVTGVDNKLRVIRGGDSGTIAGDPAVTPEARDPRRRSLEVRQAELAGVGFRCVRSAAPLVTPGDR